MHAKLLQSCPNLCDSMGCSPPGSSVHGILGKNTGVGCHALLQGIFPTQGSNPRLLQLLHWAGRFFPIEPPGVCWRGTAHSKEGISPCPGPFQAHHPGRKVRDGQRARSYADAPFHPEEVLRGFPQSPSTGLARSHC